MIIRKIAGLFLGIYLLLLVTLPVHSVHATAPSVTVEDESTIESNAYRSGRGSYRSPAGGYTGGNRTGINPTTGVGRGVNNPSTNTPAAPRGGFGSFFGGLAAGTLLGSLLNPFGIGGYGGGLGGGISLIGILFWVVILYLGYRLLRKLLRVRGS